MEKFQVLKEIASEARWGLRKSQTHRGKCNAQTALEIILEIIGREGAELGKEVMQQEKPA